MYRKHDVLEFPQPPTLPTGKKEWKTTDLFALMHRKLSFLEGFNINLSYVMKQDANIHYFKKQF